jgi:hypothetical protein
VSVAWQLPAVVGAVVKRLAAGQVVADFVAVGLPQPGELPPWSVEPGDQEIPALQTLGVSASVRPVLVAIDWMWSLPVGLPPNLGGQNRQIASLLRPQPSGVVLLAPAPRSIRC